MDNKGMKTPHGDRDVWPSPIFVEYGTYGKDMLEVICSIPREVRKGFIMWATRKTFFLGHIVGDELLPRYVLWIWLQQIIISESLLSNQ